MGQPPGDLSKQPSDELYSLLLTLQFEDRDTLLMKNMGEVNFCRNFHVCSDATKPPVTINKTNCPFHQWRNMTF